MNDIGAPIDEENIKVTMADFEKALLEVKPAFGASTTLFERCMLNGMISRVKTRNSCQRWNRSLSKFACPRRHRCSHVYSKAARELERRRSRLRSRSSLSFRNETLLAGYVCGAPGEKMRGFGQVIRRRLQISGLFDRVRRYRTSSRVRRRGTAFQQRHPRLLVLLSDSLADANSSPSGPRRFRRTS